MVRSHILLILYWFIFCALHSFFATLTWKERMQSFLKKGYKFYRSVYSLFALISLVLVLFYNFSLQSVLLWKVYAAEKIIAVITMIFGACIMLIFSKRFFFDLSGADVFKKQQVSRELIQTNLYKYVRHPLYSATLIFIWSIFFLQPSLSNLITCICITAYTIIGIHIEEKKLVREFGNNYLAYQATTPMLIPKFFISAKS